MSESNSNIYLDRSEALAFTNFILDSLEQDVDKHQLADSFPSWKATIEKLLPLLAPEEQEQTGRQMGDYEAEYKKEAL